MGWFDDRAVTHVFQDIECLVSRHASWSVNGGLTTDDWKLKAHFKLRKADQRALGRMGNVTKNPNSEPVFDFLP